jgi:hypothetical protein
MTLTTSATLCATALLVLAVVCCHFKSDALRRSLRTQFTRIPTSHYRNAPPS